LKNSKIIILTIVTGALLIIGMYVLLFVVLDDTSNNELNNNTDVFNNQTNEVSNTNNIVNNTIIEEESKYKHDINYPRLDADDFDDFTYDKTSENLEQSVKEAYINHGNKINSTCKDSKYAQYNSSLKDALNLHYADLAGMDTRIAEGFIKKSEEFIEIFPELEEGFIDSIIVKDTRSDIYAIFENIKVDSQDEYDIYASRLAFNLNMINDYSTYKTNYEYQIKTGYNVKNSDIFNLITHELSHGLAFYMNKKSYGVDNQMLNDKEVWEKINSDFMNGVVEEKIYKKAIQNLRDEGNDKSENDLKIEISGYANVNKGPLDVTMYNETFAEAITDYIVNKDDAADLSKEIYKETVKELRGM